ncbi:unnamed protein product [Blepharisma stoltei]|uniref:Uncharacterized protein n=1 Tax=Blepharisma stoltei TaxID=1481888 RepID=A0AAU9J0V6_9CILI|nr:unnamed protein product [Blepharisma stoltei]
MQVSSPSFYRRMLHSIYAESKNDDSKQAEQDYRVHPLQFIEPSGPSWKNCQDDWKSDPAQRCASDCKSFTSFYEVSISCRRRFRKLFCFCNRRVFEEPRLGRQLSRENAAFPKIVMLLYEIIWIIKFYVVCCFNKSCGAFGISRIFSHDWMPKSIVYI